MTVLLLLAVAYFIPGLAIFFARRDRWRMALFFSTIAVVYQATTLRQWIGSMGPDLTSSIADFVWAMILAGIPLLLTITACAMAARAFFQRERPPCPRGG